MVSLEGKRALITGGTRGVGAVVAKLLAARGVRLALNYGSNTERAEGTLKELAGSGHVLVPGDAFSEDSVAAIVNKSIELLGGLDIVVSNAGWTKFGTFNDLRSVSSSDWMRCYETNVLSHLWTMQAAQEELKRNQGAFVISASAAGVNPGGSSMAYAVSKAGTVHLTKCLAKSCGPEIRVNAVAAGMMMTEWSQGFSKEKVDAVKKRNVLGKITEVDDVALTYVALIENTSITGQIINVSANM